ncbi:hypothetical protein [Evansella tamaricis]|uniref:Uncharacterized protein n=1 Tax=Evansella tamaricis TaxID=2069301 RepID=A0ABS6JK89_9BACI|nr:hypothetical protein [Evansella tamaricis]MBU9714104.1 hypothetical protein [Evansella tamaricis]
MVDYFADRYFDEWYTVGIHPDKYADNYPIYFSAARGRVMGALPQVKDPRFQSLIKLLQPQQETDWSNLPEAELLQATRLIPLSAQREGNLVTITELQQKRFESMVDKAFLFAKNIVEKDRKKYVAWKELTIYWWEKEGSFFLPEVNEETEPTTLREKVLKSLEPKPKKKGKPSRLHLELKLLSPEEKLTLQRYTYQKGIINWEVAIS